MVFYVFGWPKELTQNEFVFNEVPEDEFAEMRGTFPMGTHDRGLIVMRTTATAQQIVDANQNVVPGNTYSPTPIYLFPFGDNSTQIGDFASVDAVMDLFRDLPEFDLISAKRKRLERLTPRQFLRRVLFLSGSQDFDSIESAVVATGALFLNITHDNSRWGEI